MERRSVELTLVVNKWDVGWGAMSLGWEVWVAEHSRGLCMPFPLFIFSAR